MIENGKCEQILSLALAKKEIICQVVKIVQNTFSNIQFETFNKYYQLGSDLISCW